MRKVAVLMNDTKYIQHLLVKQQDYCSGWHSFKAFAYFKEAIDKSGDMYNKRN